MKTPALTRRQKQAQTRQSLLRSAAKIFCRHGLEGASVDQVAQDAGYTKGAFYANFRSKEELFLVMLDERFAAELERLERVLPGERQPGDEARDAARDFVAFMHDDPDWPKLYFEFAAYAARNDGFRQELATRQRALRERMAEIFQRWAADFPAEAPLPFGDVAAMTFMMADGFALDQLIDPDLDDELYSTMLAVFFLGMQALAVGWQPPPVEARAKAER